MILPADDIATPPAGADLAARERDLRARLRDLGRVAVAFSGGVDSALVLAVAADEIGDGAVALTAVSDSLPDRERAAAVELAARLGARHVAIATNELADPRYARNDQARCYYCKDVVYTALVDHAASHGLGTVVDGTNHDDAADHRPGRRAAEEHGVRSPLAEAGLTKAHVRALARRMGLAVWDKPAMACLSSRIPYGTAVTIETLRQVEAAEVALHDIGCRQVRVRHHGPVARIEVDEADLARVLEHREQLVDRLTALGFDHVALDLAGFRSGSLNAALRRP